MSSSPSEDIQSARSQPAHRQVLVEIWDAAGWWSFQFAAHHGFGFAAGLLCDVAEAPPAGPTLIGCRIAKCVDGIDQTTGERSDIRRRDLTASTIGGIEDAPDNPGASDDLGIIGQ